MAISLGSIWWDQTDWCVWVFYSTNFSILLLFRLTFNLVMLKNRHLSDLQFFVCSNVPPFCKELIFSSFEFFCKILTEIKFLILLKLLLAEKVLWQPFCLNIEALKMREKQASGLITMALYSFCANIFFSDQKLSTNMWRSTLHFYSNEKAALLNDARRLKE